MDNEILKNLAAQNAAYSNIITRTSVRRFTEQALQPWQIDAILHAAMSAPTGVNRQPWEFIIVRDKSLLVALAEGLPYAKMTARAPVAIVVCGNSKRFLEDEDSTLWIQDLSAASENILLASHALGLGGVWTCLYPHSDRIKVVKNILDIPDDIIPFNLIPVGYPLADHAPMDKWQPGKVHYNTYGSSIK
ncbi:MAG: nitroreductase family protein [Muribaculaceae bacterium]|nr:nitroreductase family protein [Muribaculaceae bacterium]